MGPARNDLKRKRKNICSCKCRQTGYGPAEDNKKRKNLFWPLRYCRSCAIQLGTRLMAVRWRIGVWCTRARQSAHTHTNTPKRQVFAIYFLLMLCWCVFYTFVYAFKFMRKKLENRSQECESKYGRIIARHINKLPNNFAAIVCVCRRRVLAR